MALPKSGVGEIGLSAGAAICKDEWAPLGMVRNFDGRTQRGALSRRGEGEKEGVPRSSHKAARRITPDLSFGLADTPTISLVTPLNNV